MSRLAQPKTSPVSRRDTRPGVGDAQDEVCPVCKSSRYLNTSLRFLVNPECYHKMCESCVDRIFSHGPAPCPIPRCGRTLRKHRFRVQTFEDIQVEREVDIRKRVAAVFNRREDEFESLRDYNDYLNEVEDITFNLVNNIDVEETNKRFEAYQKAHEKDILANASLEQRERIEFAELRKADKEASKLRRLEARREEAEEKREAEENKRDVLSRLASGQDAEHVTQSVQLKKRMDRQAAAERQRQLASKSTSASDVVVKGLKARRKAEPETPIDPFGGLRFATQYYTLQDDYVWSGTLDAKADKLLRAGGYGVGDFTSRALCEAFAGLGVFVGEEKADGMAGEAVGTKGAEQRVKMEEVF